MAQVFPPRPPTTFTKSPPPDTATWEAEAWEHVPCRLSTRGVALVTGAAISLAESLDFQVRP